MRTPRLAVPAVLIVAVLSACSVSAGAKTVSPRDLEQQVGQKVSDQKLTPTKVTCPRGLKATVGAKASCEVIANQLKYTAKVDATKVVGDKVSFDLAVEPPAIVPVDTLQQQVTTLIGKQVASGVRSVACPDELVGTVGTSVDCTVTANDGTIVTVGVTVSQATFLNVGFDVKQKK